MVGLSTLDALTITRKSSFGLTVPTPSVAGSSVRQPFINVTKLMLNNLYKNRTHPPKRERLLPYLTLFCWVPYSMEILSTQTKHHVTLVLIFTHKMDIGSDSDMLWNRLIFYWVQLHICITFELSLFPIQTESEELSNCLGRYKDAAYANPDELAEKYALLLLILILFSANFGNVIFSKTGFCSLHVF